MGSEGSIIRMEISHTGIQPNGYNGPNKVNLRKLRSSPVLFQKLPGTMTTRLDRKLCSSKTDNGNVRKNGRTATNHDDSREKLGEKKKWNRIRSVVTMITLNL